MTDDESKDGGAIGKMKTRGLPQGKGGMVTGGE